MLWNVVQDALWSTSYDIGKKWEFLCLAALLVLHVKVGAPLNLAPPRCNPTSSSSSAQKLCSPLLLNLALFFFFLFNSMLTLLPASFSLSSTLSRTSSCYSHNSIFQAKYHYLISELLEIRSILAILLKTGVCRFFCETSNIVLENLEASLSVSAGILIFRQDPPFIFETSPCLLARKFSVTS